MLRVASSPELRDEMGAAGKLFAVGVCNPDQIARQYISVLEEIMANYRCRYE